MAFPQFYSNITLKGPEAAEVARYLKSAGVIAYVSPVVKGAVVVFHEDLSGQEDLAAGLSREFECPALLVMGFGQAVLLYHLYVSGEPTDAYVSSPHGDLELESGAPPGDAAVLCEAFAAERFERRVASILGKEGKEGHAFAYAINRHGELAGALGLPKFAAGAGYAAIEMGELPAGDGLDPSGMMRTS